MTALNALAATMMVVGSLLVLAVSLAYFKERDAVSRINALGPATATGLPLIVVGALVMHGQAHGFTGWLVGKTIVTVIALVLVSSVASNVLARAAYLSGAPLDPRTAPNQLVDPPSQTGTEDEAPSGTD